ncbi:MULTISPECIES: hypothetical protein [unclassified Treponema]|uniref:hypothetical protein n=1 Tax=unclassified Treponema TaxID=2638727 RepID=UPI0020A40FF1|nr:MULTISPECIES: hypothetical protein [unclassified Treponema]UTC42796.1 hypothetical protein E4N66_00875 [Treponema sp. OMZ 857]UTC50558.1 hypothetical protein E4N65_10990 [Treponema sp. OMZ 855]
MLTIIILCLLLTLFGMGGLVFAIAGGLLKFSFKLLIFSITLIIAILFGIPLLLAGLFFGGLVFLF